MRPSDMHQNSHLKPVLSVRFVTEKNGWNMVPRDTFDWQESELDAHAGVSVIPSRD